MLNAAVIGVGSMGRNHARVYSDLTDVNLVAVADSNEGAAKKIAAKYHCKAYSGIDQLLNENLDLVTIAVPTSLHKEVALKLIENNINILIEKPIASNIEEAKEIINKAKDKVKLMVGHIERFNPAIIELKKRLPELGKIFKIDINRVGPFPPRIQDVGVIIDLAVHDLDIIRYLTDSEVKRIYAESDKKINSKNEDMVKAVMKLHNGTLCTLNTDWLTPTKIRKLHILGEKGMFVVDYLTQDIWHYENAYLNEDINFHETLRGVIEGKMTKFPINKKEPLTAEIEHFIGCINKNTEPLISGEDGLKALELAHKLIESSNENKVILL